MRLGHKITFAFVIFLCLLSIALNGFLLFVLFRARTQVLATVASADALLARFENDTIVSRIQVNEQIPFDAVVHVHQTVDVPIHVTYPLSTVVDATVRLPFIGTQVYAVPVEAEIPISTSLEAPINMDVPVSFTYHLQMDVPMTITLPADTRLALESMLDEVEAGLYLHR